MSRRQPILIPKLGLTMTEATLAECRVEAGDRVKAGDVIFVIETEKVANDIVASGDGVIEAVHATPGDVLAVGAALATLLTDVDVKADASEAAPQASPTRVVATPLARRLAAQSGLDIATTSGSGPGGRIVADDVATRLAALARLEPGTASSTTRGKIRPLGQYERIAAGHVADSKRDIPHFYIFAEADVTALLERRTQLNTDTGFAKITVSHCVVAAVARALADTPAFNRVWLPEGLLELAQVDVGLAVEGPKGVVVPVLRELATCSIDEVARAATRLTQAARSGRLRSQDLQGGAIAISNVGMFGATGLLPIIHLGQSSILGVGRHRPVFLPDERDQPRLRQVLNLALSCDHRVIDGALGARFLEKIQRSLEAPEALVYRGGLRK